MSWNYMACWGTITATCRQAGFCFPTENDQVTTTYHVVAMCIWQLGMRFAINKMQKSRGTWYFCLFCRWALLVLSSCALEIVHCLARLQRASCLTDSRCLNYLMVAQVYSNVDKNTRDTYYYLFTLDGKVWIRCNPFVTHVLNILRRLGIRFGHPNLIGQCFELFYFGGLVNYRQLVLS